MNQRSYALLLRRAGRLAKRADEAEDLLQTVLLAAVQAGRADLSCPDNRRWLAGALRRRASFDARSAARRRSRETAAAATDGGPHESEGLPVRFVAALPPGLRTTALLALTGHSKAEIAWLLHLSDPALRQRIAEIRRRWRAAAGPGQGVSEIPGLAGTLPFGRIRQALLRPVRRGGMLASHDPDGHLFVVSSRNGTPRQQRGSPTP